MCVCVCVCVCVRVRVRVCLFVCVCHIVRAYMTAHTYTRTHARTTRRDTLMFV